MFKKRDIELIILEVLGCLDKSDRESLKFLKENDDTFCWKELGESQNLVALFPSILKTDNPSEDAKKVLVRKLNRLIFGKEDVGQTEKFIPGKKAYNETNIEKVLVQNKIDWGSLSVEDSNSKKLNGFEEVKTKFTSKKEEAIHLNEFDDVFEEKDDSIVDNISDFKPAKKVKETSSLRKLVLVSVLLFVVIVSMSVFLIFKSEPEVNQVAEVITEEREPVDTEATNLEVLSVDSINRIEPATETNDIEKVEINNKPQNEQKVIPKAPPKLPDLIEAPLVSAEEVVNTEEVKVEEEAAAPPPKESTEKIEEPTFFVAVEEMPQPIGGLQEIQRKIQYPEIAKRAGIEGKVFVRAFVDENGNVVSAEIVKGIGAGCDEAAQDAIIKTKFSPGKQRGKPIKVQVIVPVLFKL